MTWRTAASLLVLHTQLKTETRAAPPATQASEWGTIGDAAHDPTSDHSPHDFAGWGSQIVTAADFPNRPDLGLDAHAVLDSIRRSRDPRVKYGISNDQIFSNHPAGGFAAWAWRPYLPGNPWRDRHETHGHLSVVEDVRADGTQPWATGIGGTVADSEAVINTHDRVQAILTLTPYGAAKSVPIADKIETIRSQAVSNGGGISQILTKLGQPAPVELSDAQLDVLADKIVERLSTLKFVAQ
jgi:hypothetical protein